MDPHLRCLECTQEYDLYEIRYRCECGGLLEVGQPIDDLKTRIFKEDFESRTSLINPEGRSGVWRYKELILPLEPSEIISRGEGNTYLYRSPRVAEYAGIEDVQLKHEGENPTGSFKDRGMTVGVSLAHRLGMKVVVCASTGNTSASMAAYASLAGMKALVLIPEGSIAYGKLSQALAYGAKTLQVKGNFDDAMRMVTKLAEDKAFYLLNSLNPFRLEGQKSIIFEMLQQRQWNVPDWIVLPGGNLGNTSAFGKALREALDIGFIHKTPRIAVVQANGANPFYQSYKMNFKEYNAVVHPETICSAIRIGDPVNYDKARAVLQRFDGVVLSVSDEEALDAKAIIDSAGIGAEPSSCVTLAGIRRLAEAKIIKLGDSVVGILTGHILKDPKTTSEYHQRLLKGIKSRFANQPQQIAADMAALGRVLDE